MSETSDKELTIWKHFTKSDDNSNVECLTCKQVIEIENGDHEPLEKHLQQHQNSNKVSSNHTIKERKKRNPLVWDHFTRTSQYFADCNHCKKTYCCRSTSNNLAKHLFHKHRIDVANCARATEAERRDGGARIRKRRRHTQSSISKPTFLEDFDLDDGDCDEAAPSKSSDEDETRLVTNVSEFFEHEDGTSKCMVCDEQTDNTIEDFQYHISREHPELLATKTPNSEIVLIKEEPRQPRPRNSIITTHYETEPDNQEDDLTHFSRYLTSLLRSLPKKVQNKLQMELLTAVMAAKMAVDGDGELGKSCNPLDK